MNRNAIALVAALAAITPTLGSAQPHGDRPAWAGKARELGQDRREARDDRRDLQRVEALLASYDRAAADRNTRAMGQLEEQAQQLLRDEWAEGQAELARDRAEAARKQSELQDDRRDLAREQRQRDGAGIAQERGELREDRRDLRDDRRDAAVEARSLERVRQIGDQLWSLRGRYRRGDVARKRELIESMVRMARAELREDRKELREDRPENREERREQR